MCLKSHAPSHAFLTTCRASREAAHRAGVLRIPAGYMNGTDFMARLRSTTVEVITWEHWTP
jgi:hypothetical protein